MKKIIKDIKKIKKNYLIVVDDNNFIIDYYFYECFLPYNGKEIENKDIKLLEAFNIVNPYITRLYPKIFSNNISTYDFKQKLRIKKIDDEIIEIVTKFLKNENLLNDTKFANNYKIIYEDNKGIKSFRNFLIKNHIHEDIINKVCDNFVEDKENALINAKSYIKNKTSSTNMLKYKLQAYLQNKGYSEATIEYVFDNITFVDENIALKKEISKLIFRYDEYKIISKLSAKGYNINKIKKVFLEMRQENED